MGEFEKLCQLKGYHEGHNIMLQMIAFIELISPKYIPSDKAAEIKRAARDEEYDLAVKLAEKYYRKYFLLKRPESPKSLLEHFNNPFPPNTS